MIKRRRNEEGAAMAMAIIMVAILAVISLTALAFASSEARIAGSELQRTQTFYATAASIEKLTNEFSNIFRRKMRPTSADLSQISSNVSPDLVAEGFTFTQTLEEDTAKLAEMQSKQGLPSNVYPRVNIPEGPFAGLYSTIVPYKIAAVGTYKTGTQIKLEREFNNYLIPLFQFGIFSNEDIDLSPGLQMTLNGRVHSNQNIFAVQNIKFLNRVTMAGELVREANVAGTSNANAGRDNVYIEVNGLNVQIDKGSVEANGSSVGGPNIVGAGPKDRGHFPGRPNGVVNPNWESNSVLSADGSPGRFGGKILTGSTGATQLKLPLQLGGSSASELIKRALPSDDEIMRASRFDAKAQIRILIDDESAGSGTANSGGIPAGKGVLLSSFDPIALGGGNALRRVGDDGAYRFPNFKQIMPNGSVQNAATVRSAKNAGTTVGANYIPPGSGIHARILIEVVKPDNTTVDVTREILSLGMTHGEPNGIVYLQRPLYYAFLQASRDQSGNALDALNITKNYRFNVDGELNLDPTPYISTLGFLDTTIANLAGSDETSPNASRYATPTKWINNIVPINIYNVREGWFRNDLDKDSVYERGMMSVVDINMRNLARWLDGVYDGNLLSGTAAVSTNIKDEQEGYVIYISDRRGDKVKTEVLADGTSYISTNGNVDNEDIYGPNGALDEGEDVIDFGWNSDGTPKKGSLQKDTTELPDYGTIWSVTGTRLDRATTLMAWNNPSNYFRRAVRLFDAETLSITGAQGKLSPTKGITISSENMVYTLGNVNTTGVTSIPAGGSTMNDGGYAGPQIPLSIVCDAITPLSKTWFDALSVMYPEGASTSRTMGGIPYRMADANLTDITQGTSMRAAIIAGSTRTALSAYPGRNAANIRRSGGAINFPRFLEIWNWAGVEHSFNYSGSMIPLFSSTQAIGPWENEDAVTYQPPRRNWSFDETFLNPLKLPPGTPFFQYMQSTSFRQSVQ